MQIVTFQGFPCQTVSPTLSTGEKEQLWTEDVKRSKGRILLIFQDVSKKILIIIGKMSLGRKNFYVHLYCQDLHCITMKSCQSLGYLRNFHY